MAMATFQQYIASHLDFCRHCRKKGKISSRHFRDLGQAYSEYVQAYIRMEKEGSHHG